MKKSKMSAKDWGISIAVSALTLTVVFLVLNGALHVVLDVAGAVGDQLK